MPDLDEGRRAEQQVRRVETDGIGPSFPFDDLAISVWLSVPVSSACLPLCHAAATDLSTYTPKAGISLRHTPRQTELTIVTKQELHFRRSEHPKRLGGFAPPLNLCQSRLVPHFCRVENRDRPALETGSQLSFLRTLLHTDSVRSIISNPFEHTTASLCLRKCTPSASVGMKKSLYRRNHSVRCPSRLPNGRRCRL